MTGKCIFITILMLLLLHCHSAASQNINAFYDSVYNDIHYRYFHNNDYSYSAGDHQVVSELYKRDDIKNSPLNYARTQYLDAFIRYSDISPDYDKIISLADSALAVLAKEKYPQDYARMLLIKGAVYVDENSRFVDAYNYLNEAARLLNSGKDKPFAALAYNHLSMLWAQLGEWNNALENIKKSEELFYEAGYEATAAFVRSNSYSIYTAVNKFDEIIPAIEEDLLNAAEKNDTASSIFLNLLIGNGYTNLQHFEEAGRRLSAANKLIEEYSAPLVFRKADVYYSMGRLYFFKKDYGPAIDYLTKAMPYIKQSKQINYENGANYMLSSIYDAYDNDEMAYKFLKEYVMLTDSLSLQEKANELQRIKTHSELINYRQQLQIAEQKAEINRIRIIFAAAILLFILFFVVLYMVRKKQIRELKIEQLHQQLENNEMSRRLEKLELEKQMEEKEREIATTQLLISEKNKVLEQMLDTFKPYYEADEISGKLWNEIQAFVSSNQRKENEWEKSKIHFEKVHPDFYKKIKSQYPGLTENDLRLCAYIKIGMRTKEIGDMLSIDQKSVISNRYRLKKKLALAKTASLDDFIRNI